MAAECRFKDDMRADRLRDRFRDSRMLRALLGEKLAYLTFDRAAQKCIAIDQVTKDAETLRMTAQIVRKFTRFSTVRRHPVIAVWVNTRRSNVRTKTFVCYGCQKQGHERRACRFPRIPRAGKKDVGNKRTARHSKLQPIRERRE